MKTIVAYTEEIDDLDMAVEELLEQTQQFALEKNSMAIVFMEEEADYLAFYERLSKHWRFPVIGCTAMAMLAGRHGYCRSGVTALIMTADDCEFSVGITGELTKEDYREELANLYRELTARQTTEAKLCLCYYGIPLDAKEISSSNLISALTEASGGLPIYGGTSSDNLTFDGYRVFCNDRVVKNGLALGVIAGNVSPRFVRVNSVEHTAAFSYEITESEQNVVYRLGDNTFLDTMKNENMRVDREDMISAYLLSPFVVKIDKGGGDYVEAARVFSNVNFETGSGTFLGAMPEGATLSVGLLNREDVCRTVERAFVQIFHELERQGGECSTLLCTSCSARYLALMNNPAVEAETYLKHLPEGMSLAGFYAYGELCPVRGEKTGKQYNMFHNFTFTILAL
jgi:hypothetical protein